MLPWSVGRKNGPLLGAIFLSATAHLVTLQFWPVVASTTTFQAQTAKLNVSWHDVLRPPETASGRSTTGSLLRSGLPGNVRKGGQSSGAGEAGSVAQPISNGNALDWEVRYLSPRLLDRVPVAEQYGIPTAPDGENALAGDVRLEVFIDADGVVAHVNVISLGGLPTEYGAAASAVLHKTRFSPGIRAGVMVPVRLKVVVKYGVVGH